MTDRCRHLNQAHELIISSALLVCTRLCAALVTVIFMFWRLMIPLFRLTRPLMYMNMYKTFWKYLWPVSFPLQKSISDVCISPVICRRVKWEFIRLDAGSAASRSLLQQSELHTVAEKAITNNEVRGTYGAMQPDADGLVNITNAHKSV